MAIGPLGADEVLGDSWLSPSHNPRQNSPALPVKCTWGTLCREAVPDPPDGRRDAGLRRLSAAEGTHTPGKHAASITAVRQSRGALLTSLNFGSQWARRRVLHNPASRWARGQTIGTDHRGEATWPTDTWAPCKVVLKQADLQGNSPSGCRSSARESDFQALKATTRVAADT